MLHGPLGGAPCAVRQVGYFGPVFPDGQGDRSNHCAPTQRITQTAMSHGPGAPLTAKCAALETNGFDEETPLKEPLVGATTLPCCPPPPPKARGSY